MKFFKSEPKKIVKSQYLKDTSDACKLVVMSDRAYRSVIAEACAHMSTETGGILLGRQVNGVWFVTEVIDPGMNVTLRPELFSYDAAYVNHLIPKVSAIYDYQLEILGIWHRHPGSMDFFSYTDDVSHDLIVHHDLERPIISMLVNFDPVFRRTMYYVDDDVNYRKVELITGDDQMIPEFLKLSDINALFKRFGELRRSPEYVAPAEAAPAPVTVEKATEEPAAATTDAPAEEAPAEAEAKTEEAATVEETVAEPVAEEKPDEATESAPSSEGIEPDHGEAKTEEAATVEETVAEPVAEEKPVEATVETAPAEVAETPVKTEPVAEVKE